ncbi:ankyrin repeat protein [Nephila pilipes]|uniref:Ankyrin repeat protein n=1 Tax=Nephila pilipes TaxID=299642 RepID=A0A8X6NDZ1_NEPPI|nr:ankyrin repeat protein [Nephila pilipes]
MSIKYANVAEVLFNALKTWDVDCIRTVLDETPEMILSYIEAGNTCLFYAAQMEDIFICNILLQCGADMWAKTE